MKNLLWCLLVIGFLLSANVSAQPELDPTFGTGGKSIINGALAYPQDMAIQPDNKIVLVSPCTNINQTNIPFCLVRLNENGSVDSTFRGGNVPGGAGIFSTFGSGPVSGVAAQSDGKVVAVGGGGDIALARYNSDGSLDPSFGSGGTVLTNITGSERAEKIAIQPDGKIVIVGLSESAQVVARYLADGTLDDSFGTGGIVQTSIPGNLLKGRSIALQHDGKMVIGGYLWSGSTRSYLVTRLNSDGSPDTTWDGDGIQSVPYSTSSSSEVGIRSIGLQLDGRVVALGIENIIFSFNPDGSLDTGFDGDGSRPALSGSKDPFSLLVSASGKITVVGTGFPPGCPPSPFPCPSPDLRYFTARYKPDGAPDVNYSGDGALEINVGSYNGARTIAADPIGRVVVGGVTSSCCIRTYWESPQYSAIRLAAPPVMSVSVSGRVTDANGNGVSNVTVSTQSGLSARTSPFGYYTLNNVETNRTYVFSVRSKTDLAFNKRTILVDDQITGLDFVGEQLDSRTIQIDAPGPKVLGPSIRKLR